MSVGYLKERNMTVNEMEQLAFFLESEFFGKFNCQRVDIKFF
jgi:hypothetical protein